MIAIARVPDFFDEKPAQELVKYAKERDVAPIGLTQEEKERFMMPVV